MSKYTTMRSPPLTIMISFFLHNHHMVLPTTHPPSTTTMMRSLSPTTIVFSFSWSCTTRHDHNSFQHPIAHDIATNANYFVFQICFQILNWIWILKPNLCSCLNLDLDLKPKKKMIREFSIRDNCLRPH